MGNYFGHPDFECKKYEIRSIDEALELVYDQELVHETPGEEYSYSNSGMITLGAIIEVVSGQSYSDYIEENVLEPAGMFDTGINYLDEIVENRATGYMRKPLGGNMPNVLSTPPANSDGNIETTVEDMLRFDQALYSDLLLDEKHREMLFNPFLENYAYGWRVDTRHGNTIAGHAGGAPGVSADFRRYLNDKLTVVVLSNYGSPETGIAPMIGSGIEAVLFGEEYERPRRPLYEMFYEHMLEDGIEYTWENANRILSENGYTMMMEDLPTSGPLNRFGYVLLQEGEFEMAIAVFEKNIDLFPEDANCYDSLGEAYLTTGDRARARGYYEKALEVDPEFENARRMLEMIEE
jgi:CubicO group peptidase (beta-lactamase class C family)